MVFPGRFSTGCKLCRKRKVKCDEARPSCKRCAVYGRPCPGYTDTFQFRSGAAKGPQSPPPSDVSPLSMHSAPAGFNSPLEPGFEVARWRRMSAPAHTLTLDPTYESMALSYFMNRFVSSRASATFPGHLSFVPELYEPENKGLLEYATLSVAQMAAFNQLGFPRLRQQSYSNYGSAIQLLRTSIASNETVTSDKTMAAVLLLCSFMDISGDAVAETDAHTPGLFYLLKRRGADQVKTTQGFEMFFLALIRLHAHSFLTNEYLYTDPGNIPEHTEIESLDDEDTAPSPLLQAVALSSRVPRLRRILAEHSAKLHTYLGSSPDLSALKVDLYTSLRIIRRCYDALAEYDLLDRNAQAYWRANLKTRGVPPSLGETTTRPRHLDTETACTTIIFRSSRLILTITLLDYVYKVRLVSAMLSSGTRATSSSSSSASPTSLSPPAPADVISKHQVARLEEQIRMAVADTHACIPYALGDLDCGGMPLGDGKPDGAAALIILQPVRLMTYCPFSTEEQMRKGMDTLTRINMSMGIKAAF